jgi:hypothetical protein
MPAQSTLESNREFVADMTSRCMWLCLLASGISLAGCGSDDPVYEYGKVRGTVTYQGKPLDHGRVIFQHAAGPAVDTQINSDGTYELNAVVGETRVAVDCRKPDRQLGGVRQELIPGESLIPEKLSSTERSGLTYTIKTGEDTYDIKL